MSGAMRRTFPARVIDLQPGDLVTNGPMSAVFITSTAHPLYDNLMLVIWRLQPSGALSLDALSLYQEVGEVAPADAAVRRGRLRAMLGRQHER